MWGKLIVFEGGEGSGKTTQITRLRQWLIDSGWAARLAKGVAGSRGRTASPRQSLMGETPKTALPHPEQQVIVTREPGATQFGIHLRSLLLETASVPIQDRAELLLFAADRVQHVETLLKPQLEQGALILCDRYTDSTVAYQGYGRGLSLELINQLNQIATGGLESDLTLWLDLDVEIGLARAQERQRQKSAPGPVEGGLSLDRMEQDNLAFHQRVRQGFKELAQQHPRRIIRIDACQSEAAVAQAIQVILSQRLSEWYQPLSPV